jgi:hypothetical protein
MSESGNGQNLPTRIYVFLEEWMESLLGLLILASIPVGVWGFFCQCWAGDPGARIVGWLLGFISFFGYFIWLLLAFLCGWCK